MILLRSHGEVVFLVGQNVELSLVPIVLKYELSAHRSVTSRKKLPSVQ